MCALMRSVCDWLMDTWSVSVPADWLEACIDWIQSENESGIPLGSSEVCKLVLEQWLVCDLREIGASCLPTSAASHQKIILNRSCSLQINSMVDVSSSFYEQMQKVTGTVNSNVHVSASTQSTQQQQVEQKTGRMIVMKLTDGTQEIEGMEYRMIPTLRTDLPPGTKIVVHAGALCRSGMLMLTPDTLSVLGGEVESLSHLNPLNNISHSLNYNLDLKKKPRDPQKVVFSGTSARERVGQNLRGRDAERGRGAERGGTAARGQGFGRGYGNEGRGEAQGGPVSGCVVERSGDRLMDSALDDAFDDDIDDDDLMMMAQDNYESVHTAAHSDPTDRISNSTSRNSLLTSDTQRTNTSNCYTSSASVQPCSVSSAPSSSSSVFPAPSSSSSVFLVPGAVSACNSKKRKSDDCIMIDDVDFDDDFEPAPSYLSQAKQKSSTTSRSSLSNSTSSKNSVKSVRVDEDCSSAGVIIKSTDLSSSQLLSNNSTDGRLVRPFEYLAEVLRDRNKFSSSHQTIPVKAYVSTLLSRLDHCGGVEWRLSAKINDGTAAVDVQLADSMLTQLIGFSASDCAKMKIAAKVDPQVKLKLEKGLRQCQSSLIQLCAVLDLRLNDSEAPVVVGYREISQKDVELMRNITTSSHHH